MERDVKPREYLDRRIQRRLSQRFRRQYGVLAGYQARADGATDRQIKAQRDRGEWECLHRNVYRHPAAPRSPEQTIVAACLAAGPQAVASHQSAAWLWGIVAVPPESPTVTVPAPAHPKIAGVEVYRSKDLDLLRVLEHRRIPCTDPLRTLVDLAGQVGRTRWMRPSIEAWRASW
jgi:predicted transcriptional regulator of viral defense system